MAFKEWKEEHQALWEFILFNILSNVSTVARFVVTWIGTVLTGGAGTAVVLLAELASQAVNYFVQMKSCSRARLASASRLPSTRCWYSSSSC